LTRTDVELETMLAQIKQTQQDVASARAHTELAQKEAEQKSREARLKLAEVEKSRAEILERAHQDAQAEIALAREELNRLRQEWRAVSLSRDFVENEHAKLDELANELPAPEKPAMPAPVPVSAEEIRVGDRVWVARLGQIGKVISLDATGADVQVGNFRVRLKRDEVNEKITEPESPLEKTVSQVNLPEAESPGVEVSLRGMRAADAMEKLEKYLDRAYLAGLPYVRVVHGKGTGTLRKLARDMMRQHPLVAEIREAASHEGGEGVTVAKFVSR
jgi:DNA mismatch repair protein MutS2